jgi:F-type H+-transporting ATPase subunit beta
MNEDIQLNVPFLKRRVPNLTSAARAVGLRAATVSNLCTGKIPVGRAEVRTLVTLASLAGCTLDELIIRGSGAGMIETGIKCLDLFAPLVRGGTVGLVARPGMGQLATLQELMRRLKPQEVATVFWSPKTRDKGVEEVVEEAEACCESLDEVYRTVRSLREERDVLLGADREVVLSGEWFELKERLQEAGARHVTLVLVDTRGEAVDEESPYGPLDTLWRFDMGLIAQGYYPAVDPVSSTSVLSEGAYLETAHIAIQHKARKLLRRYRELRSLVQARGLDKLPEVEASVYRTGERLEAFLTQPFYIAEQFTSRKGEWVTLADTLEGVRRIMDGAADDIEPARLTYTGRLTLS